jgi:hypothetical protein
VSEGDGSGSGGDGSGSGGDGSESGEDSEDLDSLLAGAYQSEGGAP